MFDWATEEGRRAASYLVVVMLLLRGQRLSRNREVVHGDWQRAAGGSGLCRSIRVSGVQDALSEGTRRKSARRAS
jgi:hypothetical protein